MTKTKRAFTLIELLVVIVIIGILSGVGISQFKDYQKKAKNAQITTVTKHYYNALQRMNASNEDFPITTNLGIGSSVYLRSFICLIDTGNGRCWNNSHEHSTHPDIAIPFSKHLSGINEIQEATLSGNLKRDGVLYMYPLIHNTHRSNAVNLGMNPDKTAAMMWVMDDPNFNCANIIETATSGHNYAQNGTFCFGLIENKK